MLRNKSCFLFGPRQVGKSFLIRETLGQHRCYNLLRADLFRQLSANPERLRQEVQPDDEIIIIDEIQKLPELLDEVRIPFFPDTRSGYSGHFLVSERSDAGF